MLDLKNKYNREDFLLFLKDLLPDDHLIHDKAEDLPLERAKSIEDAVVLSECKSLGIKIIEIEHSGTGDARVSLARDAFRIMADTLTNRALVVFKSSDSSQWRLSLMTIQLDYDEAKNKIHKTFSNARRYSYILGPDSKTVTPYKYLIGLGRVKDVEDLEKRFSIEVVNNEFYKEVASLYDELVGTEKIVGKLKYPTTGDESHEFAVRLIGRIIFCWFLREKKSIAGIPLIPADILSRQASDKSNYYHDILATLFFEVLNKPLEKRSNKFQTGDYKNIPYLNGGLFSNDEVDHYNFDKALESSVPGLVDVPNAWLHGLFDLLERFNFTVDENTSYDTDLSIDPEMLGRVFENLLARINPETGETVRKSTGSFYTPREIVDYMVDAGLVEYLVSKTNISRGKLEALISYDPLDDLENALDREEQMSILDALSSLTVLDPACGSGAFPIGMLQKIVFIISKLDPNAEWWLAKQLEGASPELRREFANRSVDYVRKLGIIRQTIFGVDIQPIATEISRLRCFLTLIVDEAVDDSKDNRGIRPLPNLDFKFVTANSLVTLPTPEDKKGHISETQAAMFEETSHIDELKQIRNEYFSSTNHERAELQSLFDRLQKKMILTNVDVFKGSASKLYDSLSRWNPFEHKPSPWFDPEWMFGIEGFDVIIANPPYVTTKYGKISEDDKKYFKEHFESAYDKIDLYILFIERAIELSAQDGVTVYITPWNFLGNFYSFKIRKYLLGNAKIVLFNKLPPNVFDSAIVDNIISVFRRDKNNKGHRILFDDIFDKSKRKFLEQDSYNSNDKFVFSLPKDQNSEEILAHCLQGSVPLGKIATNYIGIMTGGQKEMIAEKPVFMNSKPVLGGKDISKWSYKDSGKFVNFDKSKIHSNSNEAIYESQKKILLRKTGKILTACLDTRQYYTIQSLYNIVVFNKQYKEEYLLGILNSKLANYLYNNFYITNPEVFPYIKRRHLDMLPIKSVGDPEQEKMINLVNSAMRLKDSNQSTTETEAMIDNLVYKLYGLTPEEIKIIES